MLQRLVKSIASISPPHSQDGPDLIIALDSGIVLKCQVKSADKAQPDRRYNFGVRRGRNKTKEYLAIDADFFVFCALDKRLCIFRTLTEIKGITHKIYESQFTSENELKTLKKVFEDFDEC